MKEIPNSNEDIEKDMFHLISHTMGVTPPVGVTPHVTERDLDRVHRLGATEQTKPRALIMKFATYRVRNRVYRSRTSLKNAPEHNDGQPIYINEDLTKKRANLIYQTRQLKRNGKIKDSWTFDGRVLVKDNSTKIHTIMNQTALQRFSS